MGADLDLDVLDWSSLRSFFCFVLTCFVVFSRLCLSCVDTCLRRLGYVALLWEAYCLVLIMVLGSELPDRCRHVMSEAQCWLARP